MKSHELTEISYASELGDLQVSKNTIITDSTQVGEIDTHPVFKYNANGQTLYFLEKDTDIAASVIVNGNKLKAIKNYKNISGGVTSLVSFIIDQMQQPIIIDNAESLTDDGLRWLLLLLRRPRGFQITDQHGHSIDPDAITAEWDRARETGEAGPTSVIIDESQAFLKHKALNEDRLMPLHFWIGDSNLL